jgi:hypothetical protein
MIELTQVRAQTSVGASLRRPRTPSRGRRHRRRHFREKLQPGGSAAATALVKGGGGARDVRWRRWRQGNAGDGAAALETGKRCRGRGGSAGVRETVPGTGRRRWGRAELLGHAIEVSETSFN